jgi:osmotically-inducible protein OsmY
MELRRNVEAELNWDPVVHGLGVTVATLDGVVTLTGSVPSEAERRAVEAAARRVRDVKSVVNCIDVVRADVAAPSDSELMKIATLCLQASALLPEDGLSVTVHDGWITLAGKVSWRHQRCEAERLASELRGVLGVINQISVVPAATCTDIAPKIEAALQRCAGLDAQWITVETYKGKVVLRGSVRSWLESAQAEAIASCAPGVIEVTNHLAIMP